CGILPKPQDKEAWNFLERALAATKEILRVTRNHDLTLQGARRTCPACHLSASLRSRAERRVCFLVSCEEFCLSPGVPCKIPQPPAQIRSPAMRPQSLTRAAG